MLALRPIDHGCRSFLASNWHLAFNWRTKLETFRPCCPGLAIGVANPAFFGEHPNSWFRSRHARPISEFGDSQIRFPACSSYVATFRHHDLHPLRQFHLLAAEGLHHNEAEASQCDDDDEEDGEGDDDGGGFAKLGEGD